ncbi:DNA repair protein RecO [Candidatus Parcubacteria bacterium]|nr:DNA repair protein RecO [Candidatus Parcubacteria bacterium]
MAVHYRTKSFFITEIAQGESDKLFVVYTKDFGKLKILGKAIRKIKSKLRGGAGLFYLSEIEFIQGKTYKTLTDTILINSFPDIRKDLEKLKTAFQISDVLDKLVKDEEKDEKIWELLKEVFEKLKIENSMKIGNWKLEIIYYYFLWNLLSALGYQPEFYKCSSCGKELKPFQLYFSPEQGGIVCNVCAQEIKKEDSLTKLIEIKPDVIKILRLFLQKDWSVLSKLKVEEKNKELLETISEDYLSFVLENF